MNKKNTILLIFLTILLGLLISAGSYAFWMWNSSINKNIVFNTSSDLEQYVEFEQGESKFVGDLGLDGQIHSTIAINKNTNDVDLIATIHMDINSIGTNMKSSPALKWKVTTGGVTTSNGVDTPVGSELASGNFIGANNGDTITLVPNIPVIYKGTNDEANEYTVWIYLDSNEFVSTNLTGEVLDTRVWVEINQPEGMEDVFEITRKNANYQVVSATVVDNLYDITGYKVTTESSAPTSGWVSASGRVLNINESVNTIDTYYIWVKDDHHNPIYTTVTISSRDTTGPSCVFDGAFSETSIRNNQTATIKLTCTDDGLGIKNSNIALTDMTLSSNNMILTSIAKEKDGNAYKYTITVTGTSTNGSATITLNSNVITDMGNNGNSSVTSPTMTIANEITCSAGTYLKANENNCTTCSAGSYCVGGTFYVSNSNQGIIACKKGSYSASGASRCTACQPTGASGTAGTTNGNGATSCNTSCAKSNVSEWNTTSWNLSTNTLTNLCSIKSCATGYTVSSNNCVANQLTFNNQTLDEGTYGTAYTSNDFAAASNGTGSYTYTIKSGAPSGATIDSSTRKISLNDTTAAGTYDIVVTATDNNSSATKDATMTIVINRATTATTGSCANPTYNGSAQNLASGGANVDYTNNSQINVKTDGDYVVTVTPKANYAWSDGTTTAKTLNCNITKADATCPTLKSYSGLADNSSHTITVTGGSGGTIQYRTSATGTWVTTKPTRTAAGTTTVHVQVSGDDNHNTVECYQSGTTRATIKLYNARIDFNLVGGTKTAGTNPIYVRKNGTALYSGRTNSTTANVAFPTVEKEGYTFGGWYTAESGGTQVITAAGVVNASVSGWTDANKKWLLTSTSNTANTNPLYAHWIAKPSIPTVVGKYYSDNSAYTSGTWTNNEVYTEISATIPSGSITKFQYSTNNGTSWTDLGCGMSGGITNSGTTYTCKVRWTVTNGRDITVVVRAIGSSGGTSDNSNSINIKYDTEGPTGTVSLNVIGTSVEATINATDSLSNINPEYYFYISMDSKCNNEITSFVQSENNNPTYTLQAIEEGKNYVCTKVYDNAGNVSYLSNNIDVYFNAYLKSLASDTDFKTSAYKQKILNVSLKDYIDLTNSVANFNLANDGTNKITGWLENSTTTGFYDLYIGSDMPIYATSGYNMFYYMQNLSNINLTGLHTNKVTSMLNMFYYAGGSANTWSLNLGNNFDTSKVTLMNGMFSYAGRSANTWSLNLGDKFDTSNVTNMVAMFSNAGRSANTWSLNLGDKFDTSNVASMSLMFSNAGRSANTWSLNLGDKFDTSNVINMVAMFSNAGRSVNTWGLNLGNNFDTSNVTFMGGMFSNAGYSANTWSLNLGNNFDTSKVTSMNGMFSDAGYSANTWSLNLGNNFDTSKVTLMNGMFSTAGRSANTWSLNLGNNFNTSNVTNMSSMFSSAGERANTWSLDLGDKFDTSNVTNMSSMLSAAGRIANTWSLNLGDKFDTSNVTNMASMFDEVGRWANTWSLNLGNDFNTSKVTDMSSMFYNVGSGFSANTWSLNLGDKFDTSNVTNMATMFYFVGSSANTWSLNLGDKFDTSNVTNMANMFSAVGSGTNTWSLNLGNKFDTSKVTNMSYMFSTAGSSANTWSLNLGDKFDTSNVTNMKSMFYSAGRNAQNPSTINMAAGDFNNVTNYSYMFNNFGNGKATILVKDQAAKNWIEGKSWDGFTAANITALH